MKFTRMFNKLYVGLAMICGLAFTSCEAGLTYDEVPESVYSEVGLSGTPFTLRSRAWFQDQIYAVNWNKWVDNYINTQQISWETNITQESNSDAPGGTLYVVNVKANTSVIYNTSNKGYLFDASKFSGTYELLDYDDDAKDYVPAASNRARYVRLPVDKTQVIGEINLVSQYDCVVERVDNAPELGKPSDFTKPARYLVKNICYLPAGVEQAKRLYEVRITFVDQD